MAKNEKRINRMILIPGVLLSLSSVWADEVHLFNNCTDFRTAKLLNGSTLRAQFLLFTKQDPNCGSLIDVHKPDSIQTSDFNATLDIKILIHGFRVLGTKPSWIDRMIGALLQAGETNVIAVDWVYGSTVQYHGAVENITELGLLISTLISRLIILRGISKKSIHLIGVSLGAHVAGLVGHFFEGKLGRITGLDPAGYKFTKASAEERLDPGDALFVEAIHTDTDGFGIRIPVGHIDFFINGGKDQPGCSSPKNLYGYLICDHMRSINIYISSLENKCPFMAFPCSSYQNFIDGDCVDCFNPFLLSCPQIGLLAHGGIDMASLPSGVQVFMMTTSGEPYCVYHSLVEFQLLKARETDTRIEITFHSRNSTTTIRVNIPKGGHLGKGVVGHDVPLCQIKTVELKLLGKKSMATFWKRTEAQVTGNFCTAELPMHSSEKPLCLSENLILIENHPALHVLATRC
uniref:Phospholipase A1 member A n=1 Tax=Geotrypetes seraphini TaxID=260995 RepID=A0A6P8R8D2_GEOSA|nr:phospholipase A1 member A [Geotrypetes seraphini]